MNTTLKEGEIIGDDLIVRALTKNNQWVYGYYVKHIDATPSPMDTEEHHRKFIEEHTHHYILEDGFSDWGMPRGLIKHEIKPETIGRDTGVSDKNGKKIYEGDVVRVNDVFPSAVLLKDGAFQLCGISNSRTMLLYGLQKNQKIGIVGNVYENSELLKEAK